MSQMQNGGNNMMYTGLTVSHYNGVIDFKSLSKNRPAFIIAKASEHDALKDAYYRDNASRSLEYGIPFGAYHFWRSKSGLSQADNFLSMVKPTKIFTYWLDYEIKSASPYDEVTQMIVFIHKVYEQVGLLPCFYTNRNFGANLRKAGIERLVSLPLAIAEYNWMFPKPVYPWLSWVMYQVCDNQSVPGLPSSAEIVYSYHSPDQINTLCTDVSRMV
jgi:lysozyme